MDLLLFKLLFGEIVGDEGLEFDMDGEEEEGFGGEDDVDDDDGGVGEGGEKGEVEEEGSVFTFDCFLLEYGEKFDFL